MVEFGNSGGLTISETLDKDGELEVCMACNGVEEATAWLTVEDATRLIKLLNKAFFDI